TARPAPENYISPAFPLHSRPGLPCRVLSATMREPACSRERLHPGGHDSAPRIYYARVRRDQFQQIWCRARSRLVFAGRIDLLHDFDDTCAAFDRIIEMENKMRRVLQNHMFRQPRLQGGTMRLELIDHARA